MIAGKASVKGRGGGVRRLNSPVQPVADKVTHLGPRDENAGLAANSASSKLGMAAGIRTPENASQTLNDLQPGRRMVQGSGHNAAAAGGPSAHGTSGLGRKKQLAEDQGSIGSLVFGYDGEQPVMVPQSAPPNCAMRSSADSLIFNRDLDFSDGAADPRDFVGAAGARSEQMAVPMGEGVDFDGTRHQPKIGYADIPHAAFSAPGKRLGVAPSAALSGAAGATTAHSDAAFARQQVGGGKVKLRSARGADAATADRLVFGRALDGSADSGSPGRNDAYYEPTGVGAGRLYAGACGTRSGAGPSTQVVDVSTRPTTKLTDEQVYGLGHVVIGTGSGASIGASQPAADPRRFDGSAGARTQQMGERRATTFDITKMPGGSHIAEYAGAGRGSAESHPHASTGPVRPIAAIQSYVSSSVYENDLWAGAQSDHFATGKPGQRKYAPGLKEDFVGVRPVADISDLLLEQEAVLPSAGGY